MDDEFWRDQYEARKKLADEKYQEGRQDTLNDLVARGLLTKEQVKNLKADFS